MFKNTYYLFIVVVILLMTGVGIFLNRASNKEPESFGEKSENIIESQCQVGEMIFYYLDQCSWCQKVKNEGTISKIEELGVEVKQINANTGPVRHQFRGVPTFVINEKVYSGYRTFEELQELLKCPEKEDRLLSNAEFVGEKGEKVSLVGEQLELNVKTYNDNLVYYYNTKLSNGKIIYFFIVKDKAGIYRAAANACQVCFDARMGFRQEGDFMVCNTCGNKYPLEKIATEKGGCNPGPINPNLKVENGKIIISQSELEQVADLF
jgi:glutaredoxin